jgi:hypothetical protein
MQEKYDKYWKKMELFAGITLVFDPRYKLAFLEFLLSDKLGSDRAAIGTCIKKTRDTICECFDEVSSRHSWKNNKTQDRETKSITTTKPLESDQELRFKEFLAGKNSDKSSWGLAEIELYLEESTVPIDAPSFDILTWWSVNSLWFPTLAILAKLILTIPMMSIASESAFSTGGRVLSDTQNCLKPATLEALFAGKIGLPPMKDFKKLMLAMKQSGKKKIFLAKLILLVSIH